LRLMGKRHNLGRREATYVVETVSVLPFDLWL
jgi:hypothetical protein